MCIYICVDVSVWYKPIPTAEAIPHSSSGWWVYC